MQAETLRAIAKLAEDKRVRIELLPDGFGITARTVVKGKGLVQIKQTVRYADAEAFQIQAAMFEALIDTVIAKLNVAAGQGS